MEAVGAALGIVDLCIKYGTKLVKLCKAYRGAEHEVREAILEIEAYWLKIQNQLEFLSRIWPSVDENYRLHQHTVLQVLHSKVMAALALVDRIIGDPATSRPSMDSVVSKAGNTKRAWYAVTVKKSLTTVLEDLKHWSEVFDLSWSMITLQQGPAIDHALSAVIPSDNLALSALKDLREAVKSATDDTTIGHGKTLIVGEDQFDERRELLVMSPVEVRYSCDSRESFIVDPLNESSSLAVVCNLAKRMTHVESARFGLLRCRGVLKEAKGTSSIQRQIPMRFVFAVPSHLIKPQSLRYVLRTSLETRPLNERIMMAHQLAKAVMFVHSAGFVHKNIRPESIIVFQDVQEDSLAVLTGFRDFRLDEGKTLLRGDDKWDANLYRHPTRQGVRPEEDYIMQHDIYALGVCLLEIGMGSSFVAYALEDGRAEAAPVLEEITDRSIKDARRRAFAIKRGLVQLAEEKLSLKMGRKYTEATLTCLKCLDRDENPFASESELLDENGVLVGARFIEKILITLLDISI